MLVVWLKRRGFAGRRNVTNHYWVMEDILPQPSSRKGHSVPDPWVLPRVEPTTLILAWPHREPPPLTSVTAALSSSAHSEVLDESTHESPLVQWSLHCRVPPHPMPVILWCESSSARCTKGTHHSVKQCPWIIGLGTQLDARDPLQCYGGLVRLITSAFEESTALYDSGSASWHTRKELEDLFLSSGAEPPAEILWGIHAVSTGRSGVWLHTHGLWRCGRIELEMLEVPKAKVDAAGSLINTVAELLLDSEPPPPGHPYHVGTEIQVAFQPWQKVAPFLRDGVPGCMGDRRAEGENPHTGVRAVVCSARPCGPSRSEWKWPRSAVERFAADDAVVFRTERATRRQQDVARALWPELAMAFFSLQGCQQVKFFVKVGFQSGCRTREIAHEHVWLRIQRIHGNDIEGELTSQPLFVSGMKQGDMVRISAALLSDWVAETPLGDFGPQQVDGLRGAVGQLRA